MTDLLLPPSIAEVAATAAATAGVEVAEVEDNVSLRQTCDLFAEVWGRNADGVPMSVEVLRSLAHAGGAVTVARPISVSESNVVGAAVLVLGAGTDTYSLIAAARPGSRNRGLGFALKQRQRVWALERGRDTMHWTFDPLMARNARFNLVKLGAEVAGYIPEFYGAMDDEINAGETGDRLVARWALTKDPAGGASDPLIAEPPEPSQDDADVVALGPDGEPAYVRGGDQAWCRVPSDVAELRRSDPEAARNWRAATRDHLLDAFQSGYAARSFSRSGWYYLVHGGPR